MSNVGLNPEQTSCSGTVSGWLNVAVSLSQIPEGHCTMRLTVQRTV